MAKCVASVTVWQSKYTELPGDFEPLSNAKDDVNAGEAILNQRLDKIGDLIFEIGNEYLLIRLSAANIEERWDCTKAQSTIITKLELMISETTSVIEEICTLTDLMPASRQRYFIHFTCSTVHKLKQLLQIVGRLSDLDSNLYYEESLKPLVSEQSMAIHSLTSIWSATISLMANFDEPARQVIFKSQFESDEYNFLEELDFFTAGFEHARIFLMDLVISSWIKFNRLVKYDDLVKGYPFLCPCHTKHFLITLDIALKSRPDLDILCELLQLVIDYQSRPSLMTQSIKRTDVVPMQPIYVETDHFTRSYFVSWHLYSLSKILTKEAHKNLLIQCFELLDDCHDTISTHYSVCDQQAANLRLSPHREERFKLVFHMLNHWCELLPTHSVKLMVRMFSLFDEHWQHLGNNYFDKSYFRVQGLTIFQLFTKLLNDYNKSKLGQAEQEAADATSEANKNNRPQLSQDELKLNAVWDRLLSRINPKSVTNA